MVDTIIMRCIEYLFYFPKLNIKDEIQIVLCRNIIKRNCRVRDRFTYVWMLRCIWVLLVSIAILMDGTIEINILQFT